MLLRDVYMVGFKRPIFKHMPHDYSVSPFSTREEAEAERAHLQNHGFINVIIKKRMKND